MPRPDCACWEKGRRLRERLVENGVPSQAGGDPMNMRPHYALPATMVAGLAMPGEGQRGPISDSRDASGAPVIDVT